MERSFTAAAVAFILFASAVVSTASAQDGFRSPTGNIHCQFFANDGNPLIRCDLRRITNRPLPRPRDCNLDWGRAFEISARDTRGAPVCHGDTMQDDRLPVLRYGQRWERGGLACTSARNGVSCRNASGHGFWVSRDTQSMF